MALRIWSAPAAIAIYGINGWLIARERTGALLVLQVWMNGFNIVLDLVFVLGLGWGVEGVALATVVAEWSGLAFGLWLCRGGLPRARLARLGAGVRPGAAFAHGDGQHRYHDPLGPADGGFTTFMLLGAGLGDVTLAANQILMQFLHVSAFALDGFALAAETLVGQAIGSRAPGALRRGAVMASWWAGGSRWPLRWSMRARAAR